jgi:hypothetical protein
MAKDAQGYKTMSSVKVLPLHYWQKERTNSLFKNRIEETLARYKRVSPYYNRAGLYKLDGRSWFELADGRAYEYNSNDFDLECLILEFSEYDSYYLRDLLKAIRKFKGVLNISKQFDKRSSDSTTAIHIALDRRDMEPRLSMYKTLKRIKYNIEKEKNSE